VANTPGMGMNAASARRRAFFELPTWFHMLAALGASVAFSDAGVAPVSRDETSDDIGVCISGGGQYLVVAHSHGHAVLWPPCAGREQNGA
jgi:hypothetical protein